MSEISGVILVTGAAGYVGSHTCVELLQSGYEVVAFDNLCNSKISALGRIEQITGRNLDFIEGDIRDGTALDRIFSGSPIAAVMHFAGLKSLSESILNPSKYYDNNVHGSMVLLESMTRNVVKTLVYSSSAAVYGEPASLPIREDSPLGATNPYGRTKIIVENALRDRSAADPQWRFALLRYFNPVGAHESGLIGESTGDVPSNLMPYISQVAAGKRESVPVYGADYPTPDGTGVRDYIHVVDLAKGHLAAFDYLENHAGVVTVNLGTGRGYSVLEVLRAFEKESGQKVACRIVKRRAGDSAESYADPQLAEELLGWRAHLGLDRMCHDTWRWQQWTETNGID